MQKINAILVSMLFVFGAFGSPGVFADVVYLKNGNAMEGEVTVDEATGAVTVNIPGVGDVFFDASEVERTDAGPLPPSMQPLTSPQRAPEWSTPMLEQLKGQMPEQPKAWNVTAEQVEKLAAWMQQYEQSPWWWVFSVVLPILGQLFFMLCLFAVARKTNTPHAWMAWVPPLTPFLILWVVGWKVRWFFLGWLVLVALILTGLSLVAIVAPLLMLVFYIWWWIRIAQVRGKPGWMGLLMCIPFFGLIPFGHVALFDQE